MDKKRRNTNASRSAGGQREQDKLRRNNRKKIVLSILGVLCALIIALIALIFGYLSQFQDKTPAMTPDPNANLETTDKPEDLEGLEEIADDDLTLDKPSVDTLVVEPDLITFIIFGLDNDSSDLNKNTRSDIMMIVTLDTRTKSIRLASLLRDTLVTLPDGSINRLNTAYVAGGPQYALKAINETYALDIQKYVTINFASAADIIDALGGVEVDVEKNVAAAMTPPIRSGKQTLNGQQAVMYARVRKVSGGDFGRTARQRKIMKAIVNGLSDASLDEALRLAGIMPQYVRTNFTSAEILSLANTAFSMRNAQVYEMQIPQQGTYKMVSYKKMSVLRADLDANARALHDFILGKVTGDIVE